MSVKTSGAIGGGTNANVWIKIAGTAGETEPMELDNPNHDDFERYR